MDKLYMILLCLMIVPILICIKYSRKIKSDVARIEKIGKI